MTPAAATNVATATQAAPGGLASVTAEKVTKIFGRQRALAGVGFQLAPGRLCALLGPNGAGKSTLVGILSTLVRPTSGRVRFRDEAGADLDSRAIRAAIGIVAHESLCYGDLSATENLKLFASLYDVPDGARRVEETLQSVGLERSAWSRPARTYSRGMLQRLALARALLPAPSLLLLDEPFTGLDRRGADALAGLLRAARAERKMLLVVSHDLEAIAGACDQVVVLSRGKVVLDQTRDTPYSYAELKDIYHDATAEAAAPRRE